MEEPDQEMVLIMLLVVAVVQVKWVEMLVVILVQEEVVLE